MEKGIHAETPTPGATGDGRRPGREMEDEMMTYYLIESRYVGPDPLSDAHIDADRVTIEIAPARGNSSGQPVYDGWAGTTNDWAVYAHGSYPTVEDARAALLARFGACRLVDNWAVEVSGPDVVEEYRIGPFEPMTLDASIDWVWETLQQLLEEEPTPSNRDIEQWVEAWTDEAEQHGMRLHPYLQERLNARKQD